MPRIRIRKNRYSVQLVDIAYQNGWQDCFTQHKETTKKTIQDIKQKHSYVVARKKGEIDRLENRITRLQNTNYELRRELNTMKHKIITQEDYIKVLEGSITGG